MKIKSLFITTIIVIFVLFATGCNGSNSMPVVIPLEESVKEIIVSKGENYDFLEDELYNFKMEELIQNIVGKLKSYKIVYKIGNLDEDNIPEIAVFIERDPEDIEDQGFLQIYRFNGVGYELIDEIPMNYDNNNYQMEIGKISEEQNGLLMNNQVGAHSGITYGFILEDGKLKSILNDKKLDLLSVYTSNEIKDLDDDGILEFSVFTIDPETIEQSAIGSDKITLWFNWDGIDSGILRDMHREAPVPDSNTKIFRSIKSLIPVNKKKALTELIANKEELSYIDNTILLIDYIEELNQELYDKNTVIQKLFANFQSGYLLNEYGLSLDRLNELEYLTREKTLESETELNNVLIDNLNLGLKLTSSLGKYYYVIDYSKLSTIMGDSISKEYRAYINILALDINEPYLIGDNLMLSQEKLGDRINLVEKFIVNYPYSDYIPEVENLYRSYNEIFIFGDINRPNFDLETNKVKDEVLIQWEDYIEKYSNSYMSDILSKITLDIKNNQNFITNEIKEKYKYLY